MYQTDFSDYIARDGSLYFCLAHIVETVADYDFHMLEHSAIIHEANNQHKVEGSKVMVTMSDEEYRSARGMYVWNHNDLLQLLCRYANTSKRIKYTGVYDAICCANTHEMSWGMFGGDFVIYHIRTYERGHFRMADYDPFKHGTAIQYLKSIRFYTVVDG